MNINPFSTNNYSFGHGIHKEDDVNNNVAQNTMIGAGIGSLLAGGASCLMQKSYINHPLTADKFEKLSQEAQQLIKSLQTTQKVHNPTIAAAVVAGGVIVGSLAAASTILSNFFNTSHKV